MSVTTGKKRERKEVVVEEPFERGHLGSARWAPCKGSLGEKNVTTVAEPQERTPWGLLLEAAHERGEAERSTRYAMY